MKQTISPLGTLILALARIAIGWHFLYEGVTKIAWKDWTAAPFLKNSIGPCAEFFKALADDKYIGYVNFANKWGLAVIGGALMLGLLTRFAALAGVVLLGMYYAAYLPLPGISMPAIDNGHYLVVNRNLIEAMALLVICAFPAKVLGLDGLIFAARRPKTAEASPAIVTGQAGDMVLEPMPSSRRSILASLAGVPFASAFVVAYLKHRGWVSHEERNLDAFAGASSKRADELRSGPASTQPIDTSVIASKVKGKMPMASIKNLRLSRMILGGNLMGGWAHARDLIYVSKLVKTYHNREKVFQTFQIAEACGVNTILTNPALCGVISDYWKSTGGKILFISDCGSNDVLKSIQYSIDQGAAACYVQGGIADQLVEKGEFDKIAKSLELTRKNNLPAGIGAHKLTTVTACVEKGLIPDFWMKTLHKTSYWSARPGEKQHDNIWCEEPDETVAYMKTRPEPWIAFKCLAAGALQPVTGFEYAFKNGADFICVGMYDFQILEDVNIALSVLNGKLERQREWRAV